MFNITTKDDRFIDHLLVFKSVFVQACSNVYKLESAVGGISRHLFKGLGCVVWGESPSVGGGVGAQADCQKDAKEEKKKEGARDRSLGEKNLAEKRREAHSTAGS